MRRLIALIKKEMFQIIRDPSTILIAFVLPLILLFIFGYGVNLDSNNIPVGVVMEEQTPETMSLAAAFSNSRFLNVSIGRDRREFEEQLTAGTLRGVIIIPQDFSIRTAEQGHPANIQVLADGSEPNLASFVQNYSRQVMTVWQVHQREDTGWPLAESPIEIQRRIWYNTELKSRNFLIPGSIAIIMTLIGTLLSALVIAREWERGTMEAIMTTPVTITQILLGKLIPYFILGIGSMTICWVIATVWYHVPFRGSFLALFAATAIFLIAAIGQGLLISSVTKDQFVASQVALLSAFLPSFILSGFIFEISAMPWPVRVLTHLIAARYFVTCLQTLFLTGTIVPLLLRSMAAIAVIGLGFYILTSRKLVKRLDS